MSAKTMAEVLAEHQRKTGLRDMLRHCWCGWAGEITDRALAAHQAVALSDAGFGLVADAGAKADSDLILTVLQHCGVRPEDQFDALVAVQKLQAAAVRGEG